LLKALSSPSRPGSKELHVTAYVNLLLNLMVGSKISWRVWLGFLVLARSAQALHVHKYQSVPWGASSGGMDVHTVDAQADMVVAIEHPRLVRLARRDEAVEFRLERDPDVEHQVALKQNLHYGAFIFKTVVIIAAAAALFLCYRLTGSWIEHYTGIGVQHVSCVVFMVLSVSVDLSTKSAAKRQGGHYSFDPAIAVVIVEACKLTVSLGLFGFTLVGRRKDDSPLELPTFKDFLVLAVPGVVYTCNNILVFEAIEKVPLATFAVIRETRLIWNALIWMTLFQVRLGLIRWLAIAGVLVGCSANQVPGAVRSGFTWGVMYAFLLAFLNASGGVACEFAMKMKASMDINMQNSIIYASCSSLALLYLAVFRTHVFASPATFFHGFAPETLQIIVLQVITGLTVSRILKHVESVTKSMIAALCSPVIVFLGSAALHASLHWNEIVASAVVVLSCLLFLKQGPLASTSSAPAPAPKKAIS